MRHTTHRHILATLAVLAAFVLPSWGQNAHITMDTGKLVYADTEGAGYDEAGAPKGWRSLWRHNQLAMNFIVSDKTDLTEGGEMEIPAGNIHAHTQSQTDNTLLSNDLIVVGGTTNNCYMSLSLPRGYYFTGYRMVLSNDIPKQSGTTYGSSVGAHQVQMFETDATFFATGNKTLDESRAFAQSPLIPSQKDNNDYVITRTSLVGGEDMGNRLYFCLADKSNSTSSYHAVRIKEFTVYFTPAGVTELTVAPRFVDTETTSFHEAPFSTGRPDVGELEWNSQWQTYEYDILNVRSLEAHNIIYQHDAVNSGGAAGNYATDKTIRSDYFSGVGNTTTGRGYFYGLGDNTYYVETPTYAVTQNGGHLNVGYRIVGADIEYRYGNPVTESHSDDRGLITYTHDGTTYYLNYSARFTPDRDDAVQWEFGRVNRDGEIVATGGTQCIFTRHPDDPTKFHYLVSIAIEKEYWLYTRTTGYYLEASDHIPGNAWADKAKGYYAYIGAAGDGTIICGDTQSSRTWRLMGTTDLGEEPQFSNAYNSNTSSAALAHRLPSTIAAFTPHDYTLQAYDKTGNTVVATEHVSSYNNMGTITLDDLNNDAIKFAISGLGDAADARALVRVKLRVEALNPYMNRVKVVCQQPQSVGSRKVSQTFTSNDFNVRGGKIVIYVPTGFMGNNPNDPCTITFEDLYNRYGDETYPNSTVSDGHARYSFVNSSYYSSFTSLYSSEYLTAQSMTSDTKTRVTAVGTQPFKPNNIADLAEGTAVGTMHVEDYKFSTADYTSATSPRTLTGVPGAFEQVTLSQSDNNKKAYLFTSDETRYNIAPTTATEHRSYAYYDLAMEFEVKDFTPQFSWHKVYDRTFYSRPERPYYNGSYASLQTRAADTQATDAMYGLELHTQEKVDGQDGYITYTDLSRIIHGFLKNQNEDRPTYPHQVLYIDARSLTNIVYDDGAMHPTTGLNSMQGLLRDTLAQNALCYLPSNMTVVGHNFVRTTDAGANRACQDIIIDDKAPFFAPYFIQVPAASFVEYTRNVSSAQFGSSSKATIMLPFTIAVNSTGRHMDSSGDCDFTLHTMATDNCLGTNPDAPQTPKSYFSDRGTYGMVSSTEPNHAYLVDIEKYDPDAPNVFTIRQTGAYIAPTVEDYDASKTYTGTVTDATPSTGTVDGTTLTLTGAASYSGVELPKEGVSGESQGYFYFAQNALLNSSNVGSNYTSVFGYPFRAYYAYNSTNAAKARALRGLAIAFGDNPDAGAATGITAPTQSAAYTITPMSGAAQITATAPCRVTLATPTGTTAATVTLTSGETRRITLAPGVYIANGHKFTIKP